MLVAAFAAYCALAVLATYPLALNLSSQLPKDLGDPLVAVSLLWWNALVTPLTASWWDGPGFFPLHGTMAFSSHFLGASMIAAPLQWIGLDTVTAYNLTFLASFPLSAIAAHLLVLTLTGRHDAAIVGGLAFGFNPFRVAHVEHLELLLAAGMPMALMALHRYVESRQRRWLALFSTALVAQALSSSYYALFFTVFFAMWIVWFVRPREWRALVAIGIAGGMAMLAVWPIVAGYGDVHSGYSWRRDLVEEVLTFSADVSSFVTASPLSAFWGWTSPLNGAERQLFPGIAIAALVATGSVWAVRRSAAASDHWTVVSRILLAIAVVFVSIAAAAKIGGPWTIDSGAVHVSVTTAYKPLSVGAAVAVLAILCTATFRDAFRRRSALAFYVIAAAILFVCSLGPQPTLFGTRILYEPPYAWLMRLPFFGDTIRAPARFAMLGVLALSVGAGLAFDRLFPPAMRARALVIVALAVICDGWMQPFPLATVPHATFTIPQGKRPAAVLELPLGDVYRDTAAMYRSTIHGVRVVNGYNGFEPIRYQVLRRGLAEADPTILDALASFGPMLIAVDNSADSGGRSKSFVSSHPKTTRLGDEEHWTLYWLPHQPRHKSRPRCAGDSMTIAAAFDAHGQIDPGILSDRTPDTRWVAGENSDRGPMVLDLGHTLHPCAVDISMGSVALYYPGWLEVATSTDGVNWRAEFSGPMAGSVWLAALADGRDALITVPLSGGATRFLRLRAEQSNAGDAWVIGDVVVR